jgi:hypothetical protein
VERYTALVAFIPFIPRIGDKAQSTGQTRGKRWIGHGRVRRKTIKQASLLRSAFNEMQALPQPEQLWYDTWQMDRPICKAQITQGNLRRSSVVSYPVATGH